nr:hypothetical protein [Sinorhizobium medicae]
MKGTVAPPSNNSTAAATCAALALISLAMMAAMGLAVVTILSFHFLFRP